jgi:hypothetical protein
MQALLIVVTKSSASWERLFEVQLHSKHSSIVETVKVPTHNINDKHPNEDNKETIHRICKVEDND